MALQVVAKRPLPKLFKRYLFEAREKMRDNRIAGSSRAQHKKVHTDVLYDVEIDTSAPLVHLSSTSSPRYTNTKEN